MPDSPRPSEPSPDTWKLRRVCAGEYQTRDGRFDVIKDPSDWGATSWLIFDREDIKAGARDYPLVEESLAAARFTLREWARESIHAL